MLMLTRAGREALAKQHSQARGSPKKGQLPPKQRRAEESGLQRDARAHQSVRGRPGHKVLLHIPANSV